MSQNCKSTYSAATTRDANNNTLYHSGGAQGYTGRSYTPPTYTPNAGYQQVTAKVLIGSMAAINDLNKVKEASTEREARRTH